MPYSSPRPPGVDPRLAVVHTGEGILTALGLAVFLDNNPNASAHAAADGSELRDGLVPDTRAAWTAGPTGNSVGLHIETAAFACMTREHWLSESDVDVWVPWLDKGRGGWRRIKKPRQMVRNVGAWLRTKHDRWGIPLVKLSAADLRAGRAGVCGHIEISYAWGETDHTDPGNFPFDVAINDARGTTPQEDDDMSRVITGEWAPGTNAQHLVTFPTQRGDAFIGFATGWSDAQVASVLFIASGKKYLAEVAPFKLPSDDRKWFQIPRNCDQVSIQYTSAHPVAYSLELA